MTAIISTVEYRSLVEGIRRNDLMNGEIILTTRSHTAWGGAVTASMYLPLERSRVWQQLTDYPRWVEYFPDLTCSQVIAPATSATSSAKRLYQAATKSFLLFNIQVEIYLQVFENFQRQIQFRLESGSFKDFSADLKLHDHGNGTIVTYSVEATPTLPVPSLFIQQAIQLDLPTNMKTMRQVICQSNRRLKSSSY